MACSEANDAVGDGVVDLRDSLLRDVAPENPKQKVKKKLAKNKFFYDKKNQHALCFMINDFVYDKLYDKLLCMNFVLR